MSMRQGSAWWLLGITSIALLATSALWSPRAHGSQRASPHRGPVSTHASLHHRVSEPLVLTPAPAAPIEAARPPVTRLAARPHVERPLAILVEDEPPPLAPLLWEDLFPGQRRAKGLPNDAQSMSPCFDQLQGIEGLSPCPAQTPRR